MRSVVEDRDAGSVEDRDRVCGAVRGGPCQLRQPVPGAPDFYKRLSAYRLYYIYNAVRGEPGQPRQPVTGAPGFHYLCDIYQIIMSWRTRPARPACARCAVIWREGASPGPKKEPSLAVFTVWSVGVGPSPLTRAGIDRAGL